MWSGFDTTTPVFVNMMNQRAAQTGVNDTPFTNPPGVDTANPCSTAWDRWLLARTAMQNTLFREITGATTQTIHFEKATGIQASRSGNYSWLAGLKSQDGRIVGVKPGGICDVTPRWANIPFAPAGQ